MTRPASQRRARGRRCCPAAMISVGLPRGTTPCDAVGEDFDDRAARRGLAGAAVGALEGQRSMRTESHRGTAPTWDKLALTRPRAFRDCLNPRFPGHARRGRPHREPAAGAWSTVSPSRNVLRGTPTWDVEWV